MLREEENPSDNRQHELLPFVVNMCNLKENKVTVVLRYMEGKIRGTTGSVNNFISEA